MSSGGTRLLPSSASKHALKRPRIDWSQLEWKRQKGIIVLSLDLFYEQANAQGSRKGRVFPCHVRFRPGMR